MKLTVKNSYTKITIDHASKIGWIKLSLAKNINKKENINPNNKLPPSPKNIFGKFNKEKLNIKKIQIGINKINKNNLTSLLGIKKYNMPSVEIDVKLKVPSIPSK